MSKAKPRRRRSNETGGGGSGRGNGRWGRLSDVITPGAPPPPNIERAGRTLEQHNRRGRGSRRLDDGGSVEDRVRTESQRSRARAEEERRQREELTDFGLGLPSLGGPAVIPEPQLGAYVAPYDQATLQAHQVYNDTVPVLGNIYDDLATALQTRQAQATQQAQDARGAAQREQQQIMSQAGALTAPTTLGTALGGTPQADEQARADRAFLMQRFADEQQLASDMAQADQTESQGRRQDAEAMRSGSLSTARTNLDAMLTELGFGRAQAQQQYQQDLGQVRAANTDARNQFALMQQELAERQLEYEREREGRWVDQNERIAQAALTTGRQQWESQFERRLQRQPMSTEALMAIVDEGGSREGSLQLLNAMWDDLARGSVPDEESGGRRFGGRRIDPDKIRRWVIEYYDENERVDPGAYRQLGGDPTYLRDRAFYL